MLLATGDVVAFFGIVCTSTRSKIDLAVESLGVTLFTHYCAVRIDRPKTEHVSQNQNARHALAERTTDRQQQTAWPVLAFSDRMPLNTHFGAYPRRTAPKRSSTHAGPPRKDCRVLVVVPCLKCLGIPPSTFITPFPFFYSCECHWCLWCTWTQE